MYISITDNKPANYNSHDILFYKSFNAVVPISFFPGGGGVTDVESE